MITPISKSFPSPSPRQNELFSPATAHASCNPAILSLHEPGAFGAFALILSAWSSKDNLRRLLRESAWSPYLGKSMRPRQPMGCLHSFPEVNGQAGNLRG